MITTSHLESGWCEQLQEKTVENLLVEPEGRETAAAVGWTTLEIAKR